MLYACIFAAFLGVILTIFAQKSNRKPILGIYTQPGKWYWLKFIVFLGMFYYRKYSNRIKLTNSGNGTAGQGAKVTLDVDKLERPQKLSQHPLAFDAVFFIATAKTDAGNVYIVAGCERRHHGICMGPVYIAIPGRGLLCSKKLPDGVNFGAEAEQFGAEGLLLQPLEPMKKWHIQYRGEMWYQNQPNELVNVDLEGTFISDEKYFDYDSDLYGPAVARSIAREPWSKEYFDGLKDAHQSHYEQFGTMKANIKINEQSFTYELRSFRDHSFGGKRDWKLMHRYAFHQIFLEDGNNMVVGVVCQPSTSTRFEIGFVSLPNGDQFPLEWCDLELYQHGENGTAPRDYAYRFKAGGQIYTVQVMVEHESTHYVSFEWEARMVERFCRYKVDGIDGIGVSEFHYNNKNGRPQKYKDNDPQWYKEMNK